MLKLTFTTQEAEEVTVFLAPGEHIIYADGIIKVGERSYFITDEEYSKAMERLDQEYIYRFILLQVPPPSSPPSDEDWPFKQSDEDWPYKPSPYKDPTEDPPWEPQWAKRPWWWEKLTCQCRIDNNKCDKKAREE